MFSGFLYSFLLAAGTDTANSVSSAIGSSAIPALITAIGGIVVGIVAANRASRTDKIKADAQERAEILKGYGEIVKSLQEEIERTRHEQLEEIADWDDEKLKFKDQIDDLKERMRETKEDLWYYKERERNPGSPTNPTTKKDSHGPGSNEPSKEKG